MKVRSVLAGAVVAVTVGSVVPPAAAAGPVWSVTDPVVTPVLADDPYTPVLVGSDDPNSGDRGDCSITGRDEERGATGEDGVRFATGCGGVLMRVTIGSDVEGVDGVARMGATTTSTYGCVHPRSGRTRTVLTSTRRVAGLSNTFEIPVVQPPPSHLFAFSLLPLETVRCPGKHRPSHLSTTVSDLRVSIEPFSTSGPQEVHEVPGTWTVERPTAPRPGRR